MKKVLSMLVCLCMILTALPMAGFATEGEETVTYTAGDLVWSQDFESADAGSIYNQTTTAASVDTTGGLHYRMAAQGGTTNTNVIDGAVNNHLDFDFTTTTAAGYSGVFIDVPESAKDANGLFTFEADVKFDVPSNAPTDYYTMGVYGDAASRTPYRAEAKLTPPAMGAQIAQAYKIESNGGGAVGLDSTANIAKYLYPEESGTQLPLYYPYAWNNYRFVVRRNTTDYYYMDVYVNGWYSYTIYARKQTGDASKVMTNSPKYVGLAMEITAGHTGGFSLDNLKFYYGITEESQAKYSKGKFTTGKFTFDSLAAQTYDVQGAANNTSPVIEGADGGIMIGQIGRAGSWNNFPQTLEIKKGQGGKAENNSSLTAGNTGNIQIYKNATDNQSAATAYSTSVATAVAEGDTIEFASDIMFTSKDDSVALITRTHDKSNGGIEGVIYLTPNFYGHGTGLNAAKGNLATITPGLPLNKWIKVKVAITRGTATTANKYSIYADNIGIVENAELTKWYTNETNETSATGDTLARGLSTLQLIGNASYDEITISRYIGGQSYSVDTNVPVILGKDNPTGANPSIRGKVFAGDKTIAEILEQFSVDTDTAVASYVVRDANGKTVDDYTEPAGGKYIDILAVGGEHLYATLSANNYLQNITDANEGALGDFTLAEDLTAADKAAGYGRLASDNSIELTNVTATEVQATYEVNSHNDNVVEFSFLPNEDTNFNFGFDWTLAWNNTIGDSSIRRYPTHLTIKDGKVTGAGNNNTVQEIGTYKSGEWTKVRLVFDHSSFWINVSVNDGTPAKYALGPGGYINTLNNVYITVPANGSVIIDDLKVIDGTLADIAAPSITEIEDEGLVLKSKAIIADDTLIGGFVADAFDTVKVSPAGTVKQFIDENGALLTLDENNDSTVDKYVLVNNGTYTYYNVGFYNFDCITIGDGTAKIELIDKAMADINGAKLITAVYSGTRLKTAKLTDLTFAEDENGVPVATVSAYEAPASENGDTVKYFVWNMSSLAPLCDNK